MSVISARTGSENSFIFVSSKELTLDGTAFVKLTQNRAARLSPTKTRARIVFEHGRRTIKLFSYTHLSGEDISFGIHSSAV